MGSMTALPTFEDMVITLGNESYYINSRLKSRSLREQIRCFYYILVIFCINIHFS